MSRINVQQRHSDNVPGIQVHAHGGRFSTSTAQCIRALCLIQPGIHSYSYRGSMLYQVIMEPTCVPQLHFMLNL